VAARAGAGDRRDDPFADSLAPLVKHDRVHDNDQTVVTMWDLSAWERAGEMPRTAVTWHRAMLKRAVKHADAVVVPTHAMAHHLAEIAPSATGSA
jgi:hypothetical protein